MRSMGLVWADRRHPLSLVVMCACLCEPGLSVIHGLVTMAWVQPLSHTAHPQGQWSHNLPCCWTEDKWGYERRARVSLKRLQGCALEGSLLQSTAGGDLCQVIGQLHSEYGTTGKYSGWFSLTVICYTTVYLSITLYLTSGKFSPSITHICAHSPA